MPSLKQLLENHAPLLVIDAASAVVQVGIVKSRDASRWASSNEEAAVGTFRCLDELAVQPHDCGAWIFCDGPGSILGIRTVAMALRAWAAIEARPTFAYHSLELVTHALGQPNLGVIADARRDLWHVFQLGKNLRRTTVAELPSDLIMPENFRHWSAPPVGVRTVPYEIGYLLVRTELADIFHEVRAPDAFLHEEPSYVTWTPQIHRAPPTGN